MKVTRFNSTRNPIILAAALGVILALIATGCGNQPASVEAAETLTPTAPPPEPSTTPLPTSTPQPSSTPTSVPTETATPEPTATPTPDLQSTQDALATQQAHDLMAKIAPELEKMGLSPETGYLAWYSTNPESLTLFDYDAKKYLPIGDDLILGDFVLFTDVTWESTGGFATCGVIFRADSEMLKGKHYLFQAIRLVGFPGWDIELWDGNQFIKNVTDRVQSHRIIDQDQGATNSYMLHVEGEKMTAYANGTRLRGQFDKTRLDGLLALYAWQESGKTTCTFNNGWVWALK